MMAERSASERVVRAELGELRAQNLLLRAQIAQLRVREGGLVEEIRLLRERVVDLEAQVGQNPRNSHKPPSSEGYEKPAPRSRRERTDRSPGGQPGHDGTTLRQVETPDEVVVHVPAACGSCGGPLTLASVVSTEARQVFDLPPIRLRVVEHRLQHRRCGCGRVTMADVPAGVGGPAQYGGRLKALATYLLAAQHLPLARTAELLTDLAGAPVSQGSLQRWYTDAAAGLDGFDEVLRQGLVAADVLGVDETGIRLDGRLAWVHAARTDLLTRYTVSPRRGVEAMRQAGVLPELTPDTVLVSDFWGPYWSFDVLHAVCGAHLGRELVAAADIDAQTVWAEPLERLLGEINNTATAARAVGADGLAPSLLATYRRRYHDLIEAGWNANPDHRRSVRGKRRRPKHVNLLDRLDTHRDEVLRYAADLRVPYTNNGSERDIRPLKIRLKVAGCLRSMTGAEAFCRLRSYLSTARKQGKSGFDVIAMLHQGNPWIPVTTG